MPVRATACSLATLALCALLSCKEDIPRPPSQPDDDGGSVTPADVSSLDGPEAKPDVVDATPAPTCGGAGQACCPGNGCSGGGCCVGGMCVANGTPCRADATCLEGSCGGCGAALPRPQECCAARTCTASRSGCLGPTAHQPAHLVEGLHLVFCDADAAQFVFEFGNAHLKTLVTSFFSISHNFTLPSSCVERT